VACANSSSLPEVAGDAALLFDPSDEGAIAEALVRLLDDQALCRRLSRMGIAQAARFTWERTARLTLDSYARAFGSELPAGETVSGSAPDDPVPA
jgi:glycosyltransferase involved in cell wall biosynthesis